MKQSCIGIDLIEIARIRATVHRWGEKFLRRLYSEAELEYCKGRIDSLAARFAAKEAVIKALNLGGFIVWKDIEVLSLPTGMPVINLHGLPLRRATELGLSNLDISISHSKENAIAIVIGFREY